MNDPNIVITGNKKVFFASDFHLGSPNYKSSLAREKKIIRWLDSVQDEARSIYILGDIFDFWFEYRHAIPKGYARLQGKFASLCDNGIELVFFTGNHDMWMSDYFTREFGIKIYRKPVSVIINGKRFMIGHGDGLGPGDRKYKIIKRIFENKIARWLFRWVHPDIGVPFASRLSKNSRDINLKKDSEFYGDKEWLIQYCREIENRNHHDIYIFGHRHFPIDLPLNESSRYINLGDWISHFTYAVLHENELKLENFEG